jgi:serine/threonine protein kinase
MVPSPQAVQIYSPGRRGLLEFPADNRYVIERRLGSGSFGVVYAVLDRRRGTRVALKVLKTAEPATLCRFKNEFRSLAGLAHPNLVALHELSMEGGQWFFTMELVEGEDFLGHVLVDGSPDLLIPTDAATLRSTGSTSRPGRTLDGSVADGTSGGAARPLPVVDYERLRSALTQLARGLHALHQAGKLHRDIKPSNVLVTDEGRVVVLDFGLVQELGEAELSLGDDAAVVGTPSYMAPEQARGEPASPAADWYSVGVMLYEALTGRKPHAGDGRYVLAAKQEQDPPPPVVINPQTPGELSELCMRLLERDPARRSGTQQVLELWAGRRQRKLTMPIPRDVPFVGRVRELEQLREAFELGSKSSVVMCVSGRSGIGKTALVAEFLAQLRDRAIVLRGRCYERESVPFKAVDSLMDRLCDLLRSLGPEEVARRLPGDAWALARLFPALQGVEGVPVPTGKDLRDRRELRRLAFGALKELLGRLAELKPVVLFVDDLQWGDADSIPLLKELVRPPAPPPFLLLLGFRSEERDKSPALRALLPRSPSVPTPVEVRELEVGALREEEARVMAEILARLYRVQLRSLPSLVQEAGGSPLFLQALVRQPEQEHQGRHDLVQLLRLQLQQLGRTELGLLEVVAVAGQPIEEEVAFEAAGLTETDPMIAVNRLRALHLVRLSAGLQLEPYHDKIAETVLGDLSELGRRRWHLSLARALERRPDIDPDLLAVQWLGAGNPAAAARYARVAAARAFEALAFERAARLYRLALQLGAPDETARRDLQVKLAEALAFAGQGAEAATCFLDVVAETEDPAEALRLRLQAVAELVGCGHVDEGYAILDGLMRDVGFKVPGSDMGAKRMFVAERLWLKLRGLGFHERSEQEIDPDRLALLDVLGHGSLAMTVSQPLLSAALHSRYLRLALATGEPGRLAIALARDLSVAAARGTCTIGRVEQLQQALQPLLRRTKNPLIEAHVELGSASSSLLVGEFRRSLEHSDLAAAIYHRCSHRPWQLDYCRVLQLTNLLLLGELGELASRHSRYLKQAEEAGRAYLITSLKALAHLVWLMAGQPDEARRALAEAAQGRQHDVHSQHLVMLLGETNLKLYNGDPEEAWECLQRGWPDLKRRGYHFLQLNRILYHAQQAQAAVGIASRRRCPRMQRAALRLARKLGSQKSAWGNAVAAQVRGAVAVIRGDFDAAAAFLERAVQLAEAGDMWGLATIYRRRLGEVLGGDKGQALIQEADRALTEQGVRDPARFGALFAAMPEIPGAP